MTWRSGHAALGAAFAGASDLHLDPRSRETCAEGGCERRLTALPIWHDGCSSCSVAMNMNSLIVVADATRARILRPVPCLSARTPIELVELDCLVHPDARLREGERYAGSFPAGVRSGKVGSAHGLDDHPTDRRDNGATGARRRGEPGHRRDHARPAHASIGRARAQAPARGLCPLRARRVHGAIAEPVAERARNAWRVSAVSRWRRPRLLRNHPIDHAHDSAA
jgi:hypothetical protein